MVRVGQTPILRSRGSWVRSHWTPRLPRSEAALRDPMLWTEGPGLSACIGELQICPDHAPAAIPNFVHSCRQLFFGQLPCIIDDNASPLLAVH
ncbi:hypothetical protein MRX96_021311 [Rhipicephalus microplus]